MATPILNLFREAVLTKNDIHKREVYKKRAVTAKGSFKKHGWQNTFSHHPKGRLVDIYTHPDHPGHSIHHEPHSGIYEHKVEHGYDIPLAKHLATHAAWHEQTKKDAASDAEFKTVSKALRGARHPDGR